MERNTEETQFLSETEEFLDVKRKKKSNNKKLLALWLVLGIASITFLLIKFF